MENKKHLRKRGKASKPGEQRRDIDIDSTICKRKRNGL